MDKRRNEINERLLKVLERVELERPITFREKFDVLWNAGSSQDKDVVQHEISKQRHVRYQINAQMAEKYMQVLKFVETRYRESCNAKLIPELSRRINKSLI